MAFSWLKAATTTFTFKTLLRQYAKQVLMQMSKGTGGLVSIDEIFANLHLTFV